MKIIVFILLLLLSSLDVCANNETNSDLRQEIKSWNNILKAILPPELINSKIVTEEDINIYRSYGRDDSSGNIIFDMNLEAYKSKEFLSFLKGDFNKNGKEDIAFACIDKNSNSSSLIIIEKESKGYQLAYNIKFEPRILFIGGIYEGKLQLAFKQVQIGYGMSIGMEINLL